MAVAEATWYGVARREVFETMISTLEHRLGKLAPPQRAGKNKDDDDLRQAMASAEKS